MIDEIKALFPNKTVVVTEAKSTTNCYYFRYSNNEPDANKNNIKSEFFDLEVSRRLPASKKMSHNHYFLDLNGTIHEDVFKHANTLYDGIIDYIDNDIEFIDGICEDMADSLGVAINYTGEWEVMAGSGRFAIAVDQSRLCHFALENINFEDLKGNWIKELVDFYIDDYKKVVKSDTYRNVGNHTVEITYTVDFVEVLQVKKGQLHIILDVNAEY